MIVLPLVAPVMILIALCVVIESPGPVFYRAKRVGRNGRELYVLKFRKMHAAAAGLPLTCADDERFTRIGRWLARRKLDELPQLFNVLGGSMSLIGPRPEDPYFVGRHYEDFETILGARPGIAGLAQLAFAAESQLLSRTDRIAYYEAWILPQKLQLDGVYVSQWRLLLDLRIIVWTFAVVVLGIAVSVDRSTGRLRVRHRREARPAMVPQIAARDAAPGIPADRPGVR